MWHKHRKGTDVEGKIKKKTQFNELSRSWNNSSRKLRGRNEETMHLKGFIKRCTKLCSSQRVHKKHWDYMQYKVVAVMSPQIHES